jgi:hypothetical protein
MAIEVLYSLKVHIFNLQFIYYLSRKKTGLVDFVSTSKQEAL